MVTTRRPKLRKGGVTESRTMSGTAIAQIVAERAEQAGLRPLSPEDLRRDAASRR